MKNYTGSMKVKGGYYWNLKEWDIRAVSGDEGVLPGPPQQRYLRLPLLVMIPFALVMSFAYVIFLPLIGFVMTLYAASRKLARLASGTAHDALATMTPTWRPGEAHFTGKSDPQTEERSQEPAPPSESLESLKQEVARRREEDETKGR